MRTLGILTLLGLAACAPAHTAPSGQVPGQTTSVGMDGVGEVAITRSRTDRSTRLAVPTAVAWARLPGAYDELGLTGGGVLNESERTYTRRNLRVVRRLGGLAVSRIVHCGTSIHGDANAWELILTMTTGLADDGAGGTVVSSSLEAEGRQIGSATGTPIHCASTGVLEQQLVRVLHAHAAAGS